MMKILLVQHRGSLKATIHSAPMNQLDLLTSLRKSVLRISPTGMLGQRDRDILLFLGEK